MSQPIRRPITDLLVEATARLQDADASDTRAALGSLWQGFCVAGGAGHILAICCDDPDYAVLFHNAEPVLVAAIEALRPAPSLPSGLVTEIAVAGGPEERIETEAAKALHAGALGVAGHLNLLSSQAGRHAHGADARACREATILSSELHDCYTGRLRSFLNNSRTSFGPGSFRVNNRAR